MSAARAAAVSCHAQVLHATFSNRPVGTKDSYIHHVKGEPRSEDEALPPRHREVQKRKKGRHA